jgi:hypothetical protein
VADTVLHREAALLPLKAALLLGQAEEGAEAETERVPPPAGETLPRALCESPPLREGLPELAPLLLPETVRRALTDTLPLLLLRRVLAGVALGQGVGGPEALPRNDSDTEGVAELLRGALGESAGEGDALALPPSEAETLEDGVGKVLGVAPLNGEGEGGAVGESGGVPVPAKDTVGEGEAGADSVTPAEGDPVLAGMEAVPPMERVAGAAEGVARALGGAEEVKHPEPVDGMERVGEGEAGAVPLAHALPDMLGDPLTDRLRPAEEVMLAEGMAEGEKEALLDELVDALAQLEATGEEEAEGERGALRDGEVLPCALPLLGAEFDSLGLAEDEAGTVPVGAPPLGLSADEGVPGAVREPPAPLLPLTESDGDSVVEPLPDPLTVTAPGEAEGGALRVGSRGEAVGDGVPVPPGGLPVA